MSRRRASYRAIDFIRKFSFDLSFVVSLPAACFSYLSSNSVRKLVRTAVINRNNENLFLEIRRSRLNASRVFRDTCARRDATRRDPRPSFHFYFPFTRSFVRYVQVANKRKSRQQSNRTIRRGARVSLSALLVAYSILSDRVTVS